jgi:hypothetical protein
LRIANVPLTLHSILYGQLVPCGSGGCELPPPNDPSVFCVRSVRVPGLRNNRPEVLVRTSELPFFDFFLLLRSSIPRHRSNNTLSCGPPMRAPIHAVDPIGKVFKLKAHTETNDQRPTLTTQKHLSIYRHVDAGPHIC